ncbi:tape measure protein [Mycobacterium phage Iwokeuplikedis]|nr:tape measure protein [Mycobacterium phage Iwokeuplikedis]
MAKKAGMATGVEVARISVKVSPDTREFRRELKNDLEKIEESVKAKIDVEPNMGNFRKEVSSKTKGMRTSVKVDADVDRSFFGRITNMLNKVKGPSFGSGVNPMGYAVAGVALLAAAAPVVGIITTALLALPGIIALIATPIAALTLGMDGLKKAAEVLKAPFEDLKTTMSAKVQEQFTPVFEKLGQIMPSLKSTLPTVTQGLADMFQGFTNAVTDPANMVKIESTIRNIGKALSDSGPGIQSFTNGLINLANKLSEKFPGLTEWFNNAGNSFDKWVSKIIDDGTLDTAFDGLGSSLKSIADTLGQLGKMGMEFMKNPEDAQKFAEALGRVGDVLTKIVGFSDKLYELDAKFKDFMGGIAESDFGKLFTVESGGVTDLDLGNEWEKIKQESSTAWNWITTQWSNLGTWFSGIWSSISSAASSAWSGLVGAAQSAWSGVVGAVQGAIANIQGVVSGIGSFISGIWNGIVSAAQGAWNGVLSTIQGVWQGIISAVQTGVENVVSFVMGMGSRIIGAITSIDLAGAGRALMDGLLGGIKAGAEAVYNFVSGIAGKIASLKGPLPYDKIVLIPNGEALMQGLGTGMENGFQNVLNMAKEMADKISKAMDEGTDGSALLDGLKPDELKDMVAAIEQEKKRLKIEKNALPKEDKAGREALQNQLDQLQAQKDILSYQKDRLKNEEAFGDGAGDDPLVKAASKLMASPVDFAKATGKQFLSDIGIGGDGLVSKAITEGIQYIFQIGSVDEALSIKDREESKQALSVVGRQG